MPNLSGFPEIFHGNTDVADTSQLVPLGTRAMDANGNEYVYLRGTASVARGDWCTIYYENKTVARSGANVIGQLGIAGTGIVASEFGWFQIYGLCGFANVVTGAGIAASSGPSALFLTSTAGRVGTADVAGDFIVGAHQVGGLAVANTGTVFIAYPTVYDTALN